MFSIITALRAHVLVVIDRGRFGVKQKESRFLFRYYFVSILLLFFHTS